MATGSSENAKKFTKTEKSWILYDWANSVYATNIMAVLFPIYFGNVCAAAALTSFNYPRLTELSEDIADNDRIHARTAGKEVACHSHLTAENFDTGEDMNCCCKFTCYLHE